jgi:hypothetical protein
MADVAEAQLETLRAGCLNFLARIEAAAAEGYSADEARDDYQALLAQVCCLRTWSRLL